IQKKSKLKSITMGYGDKPIHQDLGREPTELTVTCSLENGSTCDSLRSFVNTLNIPKKKVHNVFLPGQILYVISNSGIIADIPLHSAWRIDKASIEQSNINRCTFTLNLLRDERAEKEF
ncbi:hypothetical protein, partial [Methanospirillum sp.]